MRFPATDIEYAMQAEIDTLRANANKHHLEMAKMLGEIASLKAEIERLDSGWRACRESQWKLRKELHSGGRNEDTRS